MTPERPRQIVHAIALLWISTALGVAAGVSEAQRSGELQVAAMVVGVLTTLLLLGVLTVMLWRGRNWARMLYVILVAMSLAAFLSSWGTAERPSIEVALEAVSFVADAGSFFLMFTSPGSTWFEPREQST